MSVPESKAKITRKSTPKAAALEAATALKSALDNAKIEYVPLSLLVKSPLNVRTIAYSQESVTELADSINAVGLLQNLVVHAMSDGFYGVAAGGRRLTAMLQLAGFGKYNGNESIPVKVIPEALAVVASMTENGQRRDMHPAEQIVGFRTLSGEGKTPAQIGDLLGYGSRHVQRMLKLSGLAPSILDALACDELTTEHCHALALENDQARQVTVLDAARQKGWNNQPQVETIRRLITESEVSTAGDKFRFVGEAAFSESEIRCDLFSAEEGGFVDAVLLDTRLLEKLKVCAEDIKNTEGWAWCQVRMKPVWHHGEDAREYVLTPEPYPMYTKEEERQLADLSEKYDALENFGEESEALEYQIDVIESAGMVKAWAAERNPASGVVVSWHDDGLYIQRGVMLREASEDEGNGKSGGVTYTRQPEPVDEISLPLLTKMSSERTLAVQAALMQQPQKAVALLVWRLCTQVFPGCTTTLHPFSVSLTISHSSLTDNAPSGKEGAAFVALMQEKARLKALLPAGWEKDFTTFFLLDGPALMSLMAFCTACSVDGIQTREYQSTTRSRLDKLETALDFHLRDWWQPTKTGFFGHLTKPQIVDALNDAGLTGAARDAEKMKKGDAAEGAECSMAKNRWVPVWMKAPVVDAPVLIADTCPETDTPAVAA